MSRETTVASGLRLADRRRLEQVRRVGGLGVWQRSVEGLLSDARRALDDGPWTVVDKSAVPPSGDRRDYLTLSEYFWPDPDRPDGLPWVLRDGQLNPGATTGSRNADQLRHMAHGARSTALAGWVLDRGDLLDASVAVLRTWFLDEETAMRPHLRFASLVPGIEQPPGWGLIRAHPLLYAMEAQTILVESGRGEHLAGLTEWWSEFLDWILGSDMWAAEQARGNNHTTWCHALVLGLALHLGERDLALALADRVPEIITVQIEPGGRQPQELTRSRSYFYCCFNLDGLTTLADLAGSAGVDVWDDDGATGRRLRDAVRWLAPWLEVPDRWPTPFHIEWDRTHGATPLHRAVARCPEAGDLARSLRRVPVAARPGAREWVLWDSGLEPALP